MQMLHGLAEAPVVYERWEGLLVEAERPLPFVRCWCCLC